MNKTEIIIGGVGGQGCVSGGNLLALAAAVYDGHEALAAVSYGSEARGTFSKSEVIISDEKIYYPYSQNPNFILILDPVAYERYVDKSDAGTVIIYDSNTITERSSKAAQYGYPLTDMAVAAGNIASMNIVALGLLAKHSGCITPDAVRKAIEVRFEKKPKVCQSNIRAFESGLNAK